MSAVRVYVVDDHPVFRDGVRVALENVPDLEIAGESGAGEDALTALAEPDSRVDVVLMDLHLPGCSGVEATRQLNSARRGGPSPRVLVMSASVEDDAVVAALRAGAYGYLDKGASRAELLGAVRCVAAGGAVFSPAVAERLSRYFSALHTVPAGRAFPQLTQREREVLDLIARSYNNRRIARELVLSEKTVRNHISNIFAKLGVQDRIAAMLRAREAGLGE
ncbi:response regulator transcription factor [Streptomyces sp. WMMC500]|uniref:response regulator n=1 Tax=Streptomyces sp. WMMC500 TaxID=3015154 RepID=UPI00248D212E|nr:response regulator transcription factor [Streptomyces sp. WMMC500]WBB62177.1 response regulator transcription factor [Streptomyces sp. WMMC500]